MLMSKVYSNIYQMARLQKILVGYLKLPFATDNVPGSLMEYILGDVRKAKVLKTYDFVDVVDTSNKVGWQVKSTKIDTPITWKRAKIPNSDVLISSSYTNDSSAKEATQILGNTLIKFCNDHILDSINKYNLDEVGYARLIVEETKLTYFEKKLCTRDNPILFSPSDFVWAWPTPKKTTGKEQLPALHGIHIPTQCKWFAWHGLGENQLHFNGERKWWDEVCSPHKIQFSFPSNRLTQEQFFHLLESLNSI